MFAHAVFHCKNYYLFRISTGFLEEHDERVNDSIPASERRIPFENMVYIGDSATDIPCMHLVKERGGYTIGVFDPVKDNREKVYKLLKDGRLTFYAPADYTARSAMSKYLKQIIDTIANNEKIKAEQEYPQLSSKESHSI